MFSNSRIKKRLSVVWLVISLLTLNSVSTADSIKVGVLHSLSGTMAISETTLKDTVLMMVDRQNEAGGLLGKQLEAVVVDPASNWPLFAEKTRELLEKERVDVIFGCWTSVSRKSVLPVIEELNGLLFYPVQYEGEESSKNVFYTGAAPNQQAIPAVDYLIGELGAERFVLAGTDYVYPRTTNKILENYLKDLGASQIVDRAEINEAIKRPMEAATWAGCVDAVGGEMLARLLGQLKYGASVAVVGNASGTAVPANVIPFLLRGVNMLGIDSAMQPYANRVKAWDRITTDLPLEKLDGMINDAVLADLPKLGKEIQSGQVKGRVVVDVNK